MMIRTDLSTAARATLINWLEGVLKPEYSAETFADNFDVDLGTQGQYNAVIFEVRAWNTKDGHTAMLSFSDDADFIAEEIEE